MLLEHWKSKPIKYVMSSFQINYRTINLTQVTYINVFNFLLKEALLCFELVYLVSTINLKYHDLETKHCVYHFPILQNI